MMMMMMMMMIIVGASKCKEQHQSEDRRY